MSDLDENMFGDSSSDEEGGVFSYSRKGFSKKTTTKSCPKRTRKSSKNDEISTDDALTKLESKRQRAAKKTTVLNLAGDDDDDDSDVEIVATTSNAAKKPAAAVLELDSSDDEKAPTATRYGQYTPAVVMQRSGVAKETCDKITQARHARYKLEQAQRYHAEDVYVPVVAAPVVLNVDSPPPTSTTPSIKPRDYGPSISLKLRTNQVVNGKRSDSSQVSQMTIRQREPFQKLLERYQSKHDIVAAESSVKFSIDGERIDLLSTPSSYDLEDDDIVEVLVTTLVVKNSTSKATKKSSTAHFGPQLQLKMRLRDKNGNLSTDTMSIRQNEPLSNLMERFKTKKMLAASTNVKFQFDGETMITTRTPAFYDMDNDDIVDVVCK